MPKVRFQITALSCTKTEDRGLLDARNEDEVYLHGAVWAAKNYHVLLAGYPELTPDAPFRYLSIKDGETIAFPSSEGNSWVVDLPEDAELVVGLAAHEEDAQRNWPNVGDLRKSIAESAEKVFTLASMNNRAPNPNDIVGASTGVMRTLEKFEVDDFLGKLLIEGLSIKDLTPDGFERSCRFAGGSRVLASDFDYTLFYRVSRDDRDYAAEPASSEPVSLALKPGESSTLTISFRNTGKAAFAADDVVLAGPPEFAGWLSESRPNLTITEDAAGVLLADGAVDPGGTLNFQVPITAPQALGKASHTLRLFVPSLKYFVTHAPVHLELASGRNMVCEIETLSVNGGSDAEIKVLARDAETQELLIGTIKATGDEAVHPTSEPFTVHSNMRHLMSEPIAKGQPDSVVWPFGSVEVESYWPLLVSLKPS